MAELTLYTNPMSRGRIARWMLEEVGAPYRAVVVSYGPPMKSPEHLARNPMGKVPALTFGDETVTECAAICAWLADSFPEARLAPPSGQRAAYYRWLFFGAGCVEPAVAAAAGGFEGEPARLGWGSLQAVADALETAVAAPAAGRGWIAGARFSAADVYIGSQIGWGLGFGALPARDAFAAYWARASTREAYLRATALDDADAAAS